MKTIEEIEAEYEKYEIKSNFVTNLNEFKTFIQIGIDDTLDQKKASKQEIIINLRDSIILKIRNFLLMNPNDDVFTYINMDNAILDEIIIMTQEYKNNFERLLEIATESNYKELVKLVDFSCEYYNNHINFFETKRDTIEYLFSGFNYYNSKYDDNREVFQEFFNKKINELSPIKNVEKTKKIC
jgi:hypothetical protein